MQLKYWFLDDGSSESLNLFVKSVNLYCLALLMLLNNLLSVSLLSFMSLNTPFVTYKYEFTITNRVKRYYLSFFSVSGAIDMFN